MQVQSITLKVNIPGKLKNKAEEEADRIGISVQDFIRLLMGTYFAASTPLASIRELSLLKQAKQDIESGDFTVIKDKRALKEHLNNLL